MIGIMNITKSLSEINPGFTANTYNILRARGFAAQADRHENGIIAASLRGARGIGMSHTIRTACMAFGEMHWNTIYIDGTDSHDEQNRSLEEWERQLAYLMLPAYEGTLESQSGDGLGWSIGSALGPEDRIVVAFDAPYPGQQYQNYADLRHWFKAHVLPSVNPGRTRLVVLDAFRAHETRIYHSFDVNAHILRLLPVNAEEMMEIIGDNANPLDAILILAATGGLPGAAIAQALNLRHGQSERSSRIEYPKALPHPIESLFPAISDSRYEREAMIVTSILLAKSGLNLSGAFIEHVYGAATGRQEIAFMDRLYVIRTLSDLGILYSEGGDFYEVAPGMRELLASQQIIESNP